MFRKKKLCIFNFILVFLVRYGTNRKNVDTFSNIFVQFLLVLVLIWLRVHDTITYFFRLSFAHALTSDRVVQKKLETLVKKSRFFFTWNWNNLIFSWTTYLCAFKRAIFFRIHSSSVWSISPKLGGLPPVSCSTIFIIGFCPFCST